jgi:hypothetical protein
VDDDEKVILSWRTSVDVIDVAPKLTTVVKAVELIVPTDNVGHPDRSVVEQLPSVLRVPEELPVFNAIDTPLGTPANVTRSCVPFGVAPADCVDD